MSIIKQISQESTPNLLINGSLDFWQRGISGATTSGTYLADRFSVRSSGFTNYQYLRGGTAPNDLTSYSIRTIISSSQTPNAGDYLSYRYTMEGYDLELIYGKTFTLSFWIYSDIAGTFYVSFNTPVSGRSYVSPFTVSAAEVNTWKKVSITVDHDITGFNTYVNTNQAGMDIHITLAAGSTYQTAQINQWVNGFFLCGTDQTQYTVTGSNFYIAQLMLTPGKGVGEWRRAGDTYNNELRLCQRYYEKSYEVNTDPGTVTNSGYGQYIIYSSNTTSLYLKGKSIEFNITKRTNPQVTVYSANTGSAGFIYGVIVSASAGNSTATIVNTSTKDFYTTWLDPMRYLEIHWTADADF